MYLDCNYPSHPLQFSQDSSSHLPLNLLFSIYIYLFIFNILTLVSTARMCVSVRSSTGALGTNQCPHLWKKGDSPFPSNHQLSKCKQEYIYSVACKTPPLYASGSQSLLPSGNNSHFLSKIFLRQSHYLAQVSLKLEFFLSQPPRYLFLITQTKLTHCSIL